MYLKNNEKAYMGLFGRRNRESDEIILYSQLLKK